MNGTYNGNSGDATEDYHVIAKTSSGNKVDVVLTTSGTSIHWTDFVLKNGSASWVYYSGQNYTGANALSIYLASMSYFLVGNVFGSVVNPLTSSGFAHVTSTGVVMLGPTQVRVTNYAPNSLPLVVNGCGTSVDFTKFSLQTGTVTGVSMTLLAALHLTGTFVANGSTNTVNITYHVTSVTK
jgi:hypothetical protein